MRLIFAILLFLSSMCFSQTTPPVNPVIGYPDGWTGDIALFVADALESRLQLNAPAVAAEAFIFTTSVSMENAEWLIAFRMEFNPSSSNYMKVYLATGESAGFNDGFYLVLGTTADNISLWQRRSGKDSLLVDGVKERLNSNIAEGTVRVTRMAGGAWLLESDTGTGWQTEGSAHSSFGFDARYFGISCHYTSTRSDKFFAGPITIVGGQYADTIPPTVKEFEVLNSRQIQIGVSEPLDTLTVFPSTLTFSPSVPTLERIAFDPSQVSVILFLESPLPPLENATLTLSGWRDAAGNAMKDTALLFSYQPPQITALSVMDYSTLQVCFNVEMPPDWLQPHHFSIEGFPGNITSVSPEAGRCYRLLLDAPLIDGTEYSLFIENLILPNGDAFPRVPYVLYYHEAARNDLAINEVMHDPVPPALLPPVEYLELFNRSQLPVDLVGMELTVNGKPAVLPSHLIFPGEYAVLYSVADISQSAGFVNGVPVSQWPGLPNSGGEIVLYNPSGKVVAAFRYTGTLPGEAFKREGGWSTEIIDPDNLSGDAGNRGYSTNSNGGTPGEVNSIFASNPDLLPPSIADAWLEDDSTLVLRFSEPILEITAPFNLADNSLTIQSIEQETLFQDEFRLSFPEALPPHRIFELRMAENLADLAGNPFKASYDFEFGRPGAIDSFDIVINELLFDPPAGASDYVELYNPSEHIADLAALCISRASVDGNPEKLNQLSDKRRWFLPGQRLCFTPDTASIKTHYFCEKPHLLRHLQSLPNFTNEGGTVFLTRLNGQIVDCFNYSPALHYPLLVNTKGVSLERTMPHAATNQPSTWHSAAATSGYGTPTGKNSQHIEEAIPVSQKLFTVSPDVFTPNQDGFQDVLVIAYDFPEPGNTGTIIIYNTLGEVERQLLNNRSLGTTGQVTWDGTRNNGSRCPPGIYIVWGRVFNLRGDVQEYKTTCVLGTGGLIE